MAIDDSHPMTTWRGHIQMLATVASKCRTILELGSHQGFSTAAMAIAAPQARVVSVDLCDTVPQEQRVEYWKSLGIKNIFPVKDTAAAYLSRCLRSKDTFDLVFHDAVHGDAAADEYIACAHVAKTLAIHDWEQLGTEYQDDLINRFKTWEATSDAKGRHLFLGWTE
jgi:predicted O-methyltransferase YrrM